MSYERTFQLPPSAITVRASIQHAHELHKFENVDAYLHLAQHDSLIDMSFAESKLRMRPREDLEDFDLFTFQGPTRMRLYVFNVKVMLRDTVSGVDNISRFRRIRGGAQRSLQRVGGTHLHLEDEDAPKLILGMDFLGLVNWSYTLRSDTTAQLLIADTK